MTPLPLFPGEMKFEERRQKFYTDDVWGKPVLSSQNFGCDFFGGRGGGGVLDIFLGEEVRRCPSYPDPV